ncbi:MAG: asparagine synthase (glutamine-hydrolyzing) [Candidatus Levybacteria bacterium RIFCSPHIGHO2_02_FULL_37_18]|nr:MAG: asparagine synthase (glutamine-hydrolyzing) [Alphaproteobacteria bacterium RIFCSPHIGHO2_01_FULL_40_8]OGH21694.1 MAG: asparagine synthase (glutamine-hydrolyzing) [Candidatus Levybacteria bacterium RIFCSPHIGHO2_02_FULL_37_18]OGH33252.1 MAG: asparagine synthase (glutamine-hydrolyzing) [Candidatus Levybacteria bacterium RIFCSPLOWO2_01_FULL_37_20]
MCGICGILNFTKEPLTVKNKEVLKKMADTLYKRGPDEEGYFLDENIGLGIRRLKVIDLKTGSQPIHNEDKTVWVVLNGEIYNFPELREKLKNHFFYTNSDTETIIHAYEEYGEDFLSRLDGMFAFALWDAKKKKLILARDRFGKKPLYYSVFDNKLIFASEVKAILAYLGFNKEFNPAMLSKYLLYGYVPTPNTIFKNINRLSAGHFLTAEKNRIEIKKYWDLDFSRKEEINEQEIINQTKNKLKSAIEKRLVSDVPLGVFLSGGIDSSLITALMAELVPPEKIKTFTIGFQEKDYDESKIAERISKIIGTDHHQEILPIKKALEIVYKIPEFMDEPIADPSIIPTYLVSQSAKKEITVALGGDGGDELFGGYPKYIAHPIAEYYSFAPKILRKKFFDKIIIRLPLLKNKDRYKLEKLVEGVSFPAPIRNQIWISSFNPEEIDKILINHKPEGEIFSDILSYLKDKNFKEELDRIFYLDFKMTLQDTYLTKVDRASMANSLEVRSPFLDKDLAEFAFKIPNRLKLKNFRTKYILKEIAKEYFPKDIIHQPKIGFGIPLAEWLRNDLKELLLEHLNEQTINNQGLFNYSFINNLVNEHIKGGKDNSSKLWPLLVFQMWHKTWL